MNKEELNEMEKVVNSGKHILNEIDSTNRFLALLKEFSDKGDPFTIKVKNFNGAHTEMVIAVGELHYIISMAEEKKRISEKELEALWTK